MAMQRELDQTVALSLETATRQSAERAANAALAAAATAMAQPDGVLAGRWLRFAQEIARDAALHWLGNRWSVQARNTITPAEAMQESAWRLRRKHKQAALKQLGKPEDQ